MTPAQDRVFRQVLGVLETDPRVLGVWLGGSFGRGAGDAWSDIDFLVEVEPANQGACIVDYRSGREGMPEVVHTLVAHQVIVSCVTADWQRYDLTILTRPQMAGVDGAGHKPLVGIALGTPLNTVQPPDTGAPARVEALVREFLRVTGLSPGAVAREEWLVMQQGIELQRGMLISLMLEANGVAASARGVKALNAFLTPEQRATLEALDPPPARRDALIAHIRELAQLFLAEARPLAARLGGAWPDEFEAATRAHLKDALSLDL